jgi:hypothetical protein
MGFIDNLKNIEPLEFNNSLVNNSEQIVSNMVNNANDSTGGLWFVVSILVLFFWLIYILMKQDGIFKYDIARGLFLFQV